jgi:hypothetical protein
MDETRGEYEDSLTALQCDGFRDATSKENCKSDYPRALQAMLKALS